jgi:hypothetical protein
MKGGENMGRVSVIKESNTGRNQRFIDNKTNKEMNRKDFVSEIRNGQYQDYYVRKINNVLTPCSKPDGNKNNNLG